MDAKRSSIPVDSLLQLRQRLDRLPKKSPERATQVAAIAELYGVSPSTVYRALNLIHTPKFRKAYSEASPEDRVRLLSEEEEEAALPPFLRKQREQQRQQALQ